VNERPYESTDLANVIEIYTASIRVLAAPYYSPDQIAACAPVPPDAARWQERLSRLHTIVAESNGVLAGFASYTFNGYLDFLFTHPAFARRGLATKLYQLVESALLAASAPRVNTHASLAARPFVDRHGFQLMRKSASSAEALTYADLPCTNNSAMNETSNQAVQPTRLRRAGVPSRFTS